MPSTWVAGALGINYALNTICRSFRHTVLVLMGARTATQGKTGILRSICVGWLLLINRVWVSSYPRLGHYHSIPLDTWSRPPPCGAESAPKNVVFVPTNSAAWIRAWSNEYYCESDVVCAAIIV
jgi:hypothetical protein